MANEEHVKILNQGVEAWNKWRKDNPDIEPDFTWLDLREMDFQNADLIKANFHEANLEQANFKNAKLEEANFCRSNL